MAEQNTSLSKLETVTSIATGLIGVGLTGSCLYEPSLNSYITVVGVVAGLTVGVIARYTRNPQEFLRNAMVTALIGSLIIRNKYKSYERNNSPSGIETQVGINTNYSR